ncbi:substrate-binding domain-containing protein [Dactylosporangium aurantiacum]|uniref:Substrate-binding domain-containing protein n=1 Tax=Dactylosporangium aurantiacum TaxID=35754 RepID=A0A9Q9MS33_9ACTN|nr:substrate-binding domain-containing protein [Dactylosporangium aurantiacum]MDG6103684.1 substrate-binding domain-containing protein [Dactylosporangium aurantiacum]UWZ59097.1 substrate-binding domain-containing protein [Dactylosporangium aurantiacum]
MHLRSVSVVAVAAMAVAGPVLVACSGAPAPAAATASAGHDHQHPAGGPAGTGAPGGTLVVHAADELRATLTVLVPKFEEAFPDVRVAVEYGPAAEHAGHILAGAPVDVFVTGDSVAVAQVAAGHARGAPAVVARNPIVIAVPPGTGIAGVADLRGTRVALCAESIPCGRVGRAALTAAAVDVRPSAVEPDPAAALAQVRAGAADAALVYRTDVVASGADLRALDFAQALLIADQYTAIKVSSGRNPVGADALVAFLGSALARHVFADAGLSPT